jgi:hypothetical protein
VDIANRIDPHSFRHAGRARALRSRFTPENHVGTKRKLGKACRSQCFLNANIWAISTRLLPRNANVCGPRIAHAAESLSHPASALGNGHTEHGANDDQDRCLKESRIAECQN